ncbi:hypothetical protein ACFE04_004091 [Oxalis oulophora]
MGFLRRLFKKKKKTQSPPSISSTSSSLFSSSNNNNNNNKYRNTTTPSILSTSSPYYEGGRRDGNKHAIAVAAATAAVAEAAIAAAHAATEVVRLTSGKSRGRRIVDGVVQRSVVIIQSAFRGYLARRALRALKALVKLQALVRGHIVRRQTSDMLRRMQTLVKVQARARASRANVSESFDSSHKYSHDAVLANLAKNEKPCLYSKTSDGPCIKRCGSKYNSRDVKSDKPQIGSNWLNRWMEDCNNHREPSVRFRRTDDERTDKILEVDTWKPRLSSHHTDKTFGSSEHVFSSDYNMSTDSRSKMSTKAPNPVPSISSGDILSVSSVKVSAQKDETGSSRPGSSNSRRGQFTPTRSECSWGYFAGHPNYMANTESSKAKVRSHSAPRQRHELERSGSTRRTFHGLLDTSINSEKGYALHGEYSRNYAYPASGRSNKVGCSD